METDHKRTHSERKVQELNLNVLFTIQRTTTRHGKQRMMSFTESKGPNQNSTIIRVHGQPIYPKLYFLSKHVSGVEILVRRLIGTCNKPCVNYSILHHGVRTCEVLLAQDFMDTDQMSKPTLSWLKIGHSRGTNSTDALS